MKLFRPIRKFHPIVVGILFMMPVALGVLIYMILGNQFSKVPQNIKSAYQLYDLHTLKGIFELVIYDPVHEEVNFRGLVFLIVLVTRKFQDRKLVKYIGYTLAWAVMIGLNFLYASGHQYFPLAVFFFGLIWGSLTIRTGSLIYPIAFHCASNAIAVIGIMAGYHLIC